MEQIRIKLVILAAVLQLLLSKGELEQSIFMTVFNMCMLL